MSWSVACFYAGIFVTGQAAGAYTDYAWWYSLVIAFCWFALSLVLGWFDERRRNRLAKTNAEEILRRWGEEDNV